MHDSWSGSIYLIVGYLCHKTTQLLTNGSEAQNMRIRIPNTACWTWMVFRICILFEFQPIHPSNWTHRIKLILLDWVLISIRNSGPRSQIINLRMQHLPRRGWTTFQKLNTLYPPESQSAFSLCLGAHVIMRWRMYFQQCCGSTSVSQEVRTRILLSSSKNSKKKPWILLFCDLLMTFYLRKIMQMYLQKVISRKT